MQRPATDGLCLLSGSQYPDRVAMLALGGSMRLALAWLALNLALLIAAALLLILPICCR